MSDRQDPPDGHAAGDQSPDGSGDPEIGSLAEEAARLLGALSGWARDHGGESGQAAADLAGQAAARAHGVGEHLAEGPHGGECSWCPLCRTVHAVRQVSPEVKTHLAVAASSLAQAAAAVLATAVPDEHRDSGERGGPVERIDLDEDWPEEEG